LILLFEVQTQQFKYHLEKLSTRRRLPAMVSKAESLYDIRQQAYAEGFKPMIFDAIAKARAGVTSYSEIMRVIPMLL
jgi:type II secretory ATPase GspE/PulE/Tfp pilus assembly ATPase PilB-like protein